MLNRRNFIVRSVLTGLGFSLAPGSLRAFSLNPGLTVRTNGPVVVSTWRHGLQANEAAWEILGQDGNALDAVEAGVRVCEADPENLSVGYGGLPDRDGHVTLDACIMDEKGNAGSVCFLENIRHPVSVARLIMENTPHVMLAGGGALQFAVSNGFTEENLLTDKARKIWEAWRSEEKYKPVPNIENHDTIGMLALDANGNLSGACTTSGMAFKMHGRVGDSPIIGAGLFVDNEVGAAVATGQGELMMKTLGSFLVVEMMRGGMDPVDACQVAVKRIVDKVKDLENAQVGYLALDKQGRMGSFSLRKGFDYAIQNAQGKRLIDSAHYVSG